MLALDLVSLALYFRQGLGEERWRMTGEEVAVSSFGLSKPWPTPP